MERPYLAALILWLLAPIGLVAQEAATNVAPVLDDKADDSKRGILVDVSLPISARSLVTITDTLATIAESAKNSSGAVSRTTVVLRFRSEQSDGTTTQFEDALKLSRAFARPDFRQLRIVSFVDGSIRGHAVLPILASDSLVVTRGASIGDAAANEPAGTADDTIIAAYQAIAERRGLFPNELAEALVQRGELVLATTLDGKRQFAAGDELNALRRTGAGWQEEVWSTPDHPFVMTADRLKAASIASHVIGSQDELLAVLDLASLTPIADQLIGKELQAGLLEISGAISTDRVRRWELNLAKACDAGELNTVVVVVDSSGGDLNSSVQLAGTLSSTQPPLKKAIGFVRSQSLGDSALIAVSCKPLYLHPDAKLGGPGGQSIDESELRPLAEAIEQIAKDAGRPMALIRGLLDPTLKVYRYTNTKTGQLRYASEDELALGSEEPEAERRLWRRGELISLENGINASAAIELGLAEGQTNSVDELAATIGLSEAPQPLTDRGLIHFVEWVGGLKGVSIFLLMVGMVALSMEAGAPGVSVPGFVSLICFSTYFWIQFLNGTAQWLEILAFALGLVCLAIELFLLPGFGVFGIGGICLLVLGLILTSQTFVIPRNSYQFEQLTHSLWLVVGGFGAIVVGFVLLRLMMPQRVILKHLALETPDDEWIDRAERLADYEHLLGESGLATTPLRPAGKARFGNEIVHVISDGTPIGPGDAVVVVDVKGNRIVVAPVE